MRRAGLIGALTAVLLAVAGASTTSAGTAESEIVRFVFTQHGLPKNQDVPGLVEALSVGHGRLALFPGETDTNVVTGHIALEDDNGFFGPSHVRISLYSSTSSHSPVPESFAVYNRSGNRQALVLHGWVTKSDDPSCSASQPSGEPRRAYLRLQDGGSKGRDSIGIDLEGCPEWHRVYLGRGVDVVIHAPEACAASASLPTCGMRVPVNVFAGQWTTNTGGVGFRVVSSSDGRQAITAQGGTPCSKPTVYYRGGYYDPASGHSGKVTGCTEGSPEHMVARYVGDPATDPGAAGGFDIHFVPPTKASPATFKGTYTSSAGTPGSPYTGVFKDHFQGDGCCP
jgi:hypothetical protein